MQSVCREALGSMHLQALQETQIWQGLETVTHAVPCLTELLGQEGYGMLWPPACSVEPLSPNPSSARAILLSVLFLYVVKNNL